LTNLTTGQTAPGFTLKALDGQEYSLGKLLKNGPVVVAFFKISCPVCQFTFPFIQRIAERHSVERVSVIGVSQDDVRSTKDFNREYQLTFPTLIDEDSYPVSNAYGLTNVPTIFLIDSDGMIKVSAMGFDKATLEKIDAELANDRKTPPAALFRSDEVIPAHRPG